MSFFAQKQPSEVIPCVMDFVQVLPAGETLTSATVAIYDSANVDQSAEMIDGTPVVGETQVSIRIEKGTDGEDYKVSFTATTTPTAYIFEEEVYLKVREL